MLKNGRSCGLGPDNLLGFFIAEEVGFDRSGFAFSLAISARGLGRTRLLNAARVIIGKDSGLKASARQLDLPALFERIDAMPMRRRERQAAE